MGGHVEIQSELGRETEISAVLTFPIVEEPETLSDRVGAETADMSGKRVLLEEDNEFNREITRYLLEGIHFDVEEAENGRMCVDMLRSSEPDTYDLILIDIQMPVMDGYTATRMIRTPAAPQFHHCHDRQRL